MFARLKPVWELEIFRNRLRITDPATGRGGERTATYPFSTAAVLINEPECLEQEVRMLAEEHFGKAGILGRFPEIRVIHLDASVTDAEIANLKTALADAGASSISLP